MGKLSNEVPKCAKVPKFKISIITIGKIRKTIF